MRPLLLVVFLALAPLAHGQWTTATLSQPRAQLAATSVGTKALFGGGIEAGTPSAVVDIYDASTGAWSTAALSLPRAQLAAASADGVALFVGGRTAQGPVATVDLYDDASGTWSTSALSSTRVRHAATSVAGWILFGGGTSNSSGDGIKVEILDTVTGAWTLASLSEERYHLAATTVGSFALFAGGSTSIGRSDAVDIFDARSATWTTAALSFARQRLAATTLGGQAFFAGGADSSGAYDVVDIFTPELGERFCSPANDNSTGVPARILAQGSPVAVDDDLTLIAEDLPAGELGYFLVGPSQGQVQPPGSDGVLCLAGNIGRFNQAGFIIQGPSGSIDVDLTGLPTSPPVAVQPGETWNFQCWYRDQGSSNFTDAVAITFL